ncbi:hypothetical protein GCM10009678_37030 [Actinomadura kijaniata]
METVTHAALALSTAPWQAGAVSVVFGANATVWGAVSTGLVQSRVPHRTLGRVTGVHRLVQMGAPTPNAAVPRPRGGPRCRSPRPPAAGPPAAAANA